MAQLITDISRLRASLVNANLAVTNNPLYQTILGLIGISERFNKEITGLINSDPTKSIESVPSDEQSKFILGMDGIDGNDGLPGLPGVAGSIGPIGLQGPIGISGTFGLDGNDGEDGFAGLPGATGPSGAIGANGSNGAIGLDGIDGSDGSDGMGSSTPSFLSLSVMGLQAGAIPYIGVGGLFKDAVPRLAWDDPSQTLYATNIFGDLTGSVIGNATNVTGIIAIANGGTGQTTAVNAFDALAPTTTQGDVIYHNGTDNIRLAKGTGLQVLRMNAGATAPEWASMAGTGDVVGPGVAVDGIAAVFDGTTGKLIKQFTPTVGSLLFAGTNGILAQDNANLFWDDTNNRLGILTAVPTNALSLGGNSARTVGMERHTTANTAGNALTIQSGGATSSATDKSAGIFNLQPGLSTGSGTGALRIYSSTTGTGTVSTISITPSAAGSGYTAGDTLTLTGGSGNATVTVATVSGGKILTMNTTPTSGGTSGYSVSFDNAVSGGTGTGATIAINAITGTGDGILTERLRIIGDGSVGIGTASPAALLHLAGTYSGNALANTSILANFAILKSLATGQQNAFINQPSFQPQGATNSGFYGLINLPSISTPAVAGHTLVTAAGAFSRIDTSASYTGTVTNGIGFESGAPSISGTNRVTNYLQFCADGIGSSASSNSGNTTGTISNYAFQHGGNTSLAGAGGVLNNYGVSLILSSGNSSGTTNYGYHLSGNGGASAINWAFYSTSTAPSLFSGNIKIGGTAVRGTTEGTNHIDIFNGTDPVGTLTNGVTLFSSSGELRCMDSTGNPSTLLSPHNKYGEWIMDTYMHIGNKRKHVIVDMQRMIYALNEKFGWDFIHEEDI